MKCRYYAGIYTRGITWGVMDTRIPMLSALKSNLLKRILNCTSGKQVVAQVISCYVGVCSLVELNVQE